MSGAAGRRPRGARAAVLLVLAVGLATALSGWALAAGDPSAKSSAGKTLYRKYCGQCHALRAAKAAGFGSNKRLGKDGGPSFNIVRVPFGLSVSLMTQASNGHEQVSRKLKFIQIKQIARFIDTATKGNLVQAQPIDGGV